MAPLFDLNQLREATGTIKTSEIEPYLEIVRGWHHDLHHGTLILDKETSREQAYNRDFFVKILGYVEKPHIPYSMEPKATTENANFPDVILGHFDGESKNISAVVELKGAGIDLDRPQNVKIMTPPFNKDSSTRLNTDPVRLSLFPTSKSFASTTTIYLITTSGHSTIS